MTLFCLSTCASVSAKKMYLSLYWAGLNKWCSLHLRMPLSEAFQLSFFGFTSGNNLHTKCKLAFFCISNQTHWMAVPLMPTHCTNHVINWIKRCTELWMPGCDVVLCDVAHWIRDNDLTLTCCWHLVFALECKPGMVPFYLCSCLPIKS